MFRVRDPAPPEKTIDSDKTVGSLFHFPRGNRVGHKTENREIHNWCSLCQATTLFEEEIQNIPEEI